MKIIAVDLGATFAWATNLPLRRRWGVVSTPGIRAHRLAAFSKFLRANRDWMQDADAFVYETPFARGRDATRSLWGMAGVLEAEVTEMGLPMVDVAVATIKKFATGKGNGPKVSMIAAAQRLGYRGHNEHEADAYCLLKYSEVNLERGDLA